MNRHEEGGRDFLSIRIMDRQRTSSYMYIHFSGSTSLIYIPYLSFILGRFLIPSFRRVLYSYVVVLSGLSNAVTNSGVMIEVERGRSYNTLLPFKLTCECHAQANHSLPQTRVSGYSTICLRRVPNFFFLPPSACPLTCHSVGTFSTLAIRHVIAPPATCSRLVHGRPHWSTLGIRLAL